MSEQSNYIPFVQRQFLLLIVKLLIFFNRILLLVCFVFHEQFSIECTFELKIYKLLL